MVSRAPRLLIKSQPLPAGAPFALGGTAFVLKPLFPEEHAGEGKTGILRSERTPDNNPGEVIRRP